MTPAGPPFIAEYVGLPGGHRILFIHDLAAGFPYSRLGREMGYRAEGAPGAMSAA